LSICDAVHRATSRETEARVLCARPERVEDVKRAFFVYSLKRSREILVSRLERFTSHARRSEQSIQLGSVEQAHRRRAALPFHLYALVPVTEIFSRQLEISARLQRHQFSNFVDELRCAVWREPHHLELIPVIRKSDVLCHCCVQHAE